MDSFTSLREMLNAWFARLSQRERGLVSICLASIFVFGIYSASMKVHEYIVDTQLQLTRRTAQLEDLSRIIKRYVTLNARLERIHQTFAQSQMSFKEVTDQLDKVLRQNIGSNTYDLKKGGSPTQIGFEYEKQLFTVNVHALSLEQVTKRHFQLEHGDSPLFLGKVDLLKSSADNTFSATLEIFSIQKSAPAAKPSV